MGAQLWADILAMLVAMLTGILDLVVSAFDGVVEIFWVAGENGGFTIYGIFLLWGIIIFLIMLAIHFITSLIRK